MNAVKKYAMGLMFSGLAARAKKRAHVPGLWRTKTSSMPALLTGIGIGAATALLARPKTARALRDTIGHLRHR